MSAPAPTGAAPDAAARPDASGRRARVVLGAVVAAALVGLVVAALAARGGTPGEVRIGDPRAGESTGQAAAVYLELTPTTDDSLVAATSAAAAQVSLHEAETRDGLTTMAVTESMPLPGGETTELRPGGSHLMLENLRAPLEPGDRVEVTLEFERAEPRTVEVAVVGLAELVENP